MCVCVSYWVHRLRITQRTTAVTLVFSRTLFVFVFAGFSEPLERLVFEISCGLHLNAVRYCFRLLWSSFWLAKYSNFIGIAMMMMRQGESKRLIKMARN